MPCAGTAPPRRAQSTATALRIVLRVAPPGRSGFIEFPASVLHAPVYTVHTVRPERRVRLADERSVRVSVGAPGSRPQPEGEIRMARAGRQKPVKEQGARKRAATLSERCSHVIFSAERCLKGPSRSYHGEGNRQQSRPERLLDLSGVWGGGTFPEKSVEQERPYTWQPSQAKTAGIRPDG